MSWNYRVTRRQIHDDWFEYSIREVYYIEDRPHSWSHAGIAAWSDDSVADLKSDHRLLGEAFNRPVLDITDEDKPYDVIPAPLQRPRNAAQGEGGVSTPDEGDSGCMKYGSEVE